MKLVATCTRIAENAHVGQVRTRGADKGKPYIIHPERVAFHFKDETLKAIAWLHDVIEDTPVTADDLRSDGIPENVIEAVLAVSKVKGENYLEFLQRVLQNPLARQVKIADIEDNMISLEDGALKDKYRLALFILANV